MQSQSLDRRIEKVAHHHSGLLFSLKIFGALFMKKITLHSDTLSLLLEQSFDDGYKAGYTKSSVLDYQEDKIKEHSKNIVNGHYLLCCPFHKEITPSLSYEPSEKKYVCFSCGKQGGIKELWLQIITENENFKSTSSNSSPI